MTSVKQIILPLILLDKINLIKNYVAENKQLQFELLTLLDEMFADNHLAFDLTKHLGVPYEKQEENIKPEVLLQLAVHLMKAFGLPQSVSPNIDEERSAIALAILLYRKYSEQTLEEPQWSELVKCTVDTSTYLQVQLIYKLVAYRQAPEAAKWANYYDLSASYFPREVNELLASLPNEVMVPARDWHHLFNHNRFTIHWVSDQLTFYECVQTLSQSSGPLGLRAKWRPNFGQILNPRVSIVQLATDFQVYLLDIVELNSTITDDDWLLFGTQVLTNDKLIKIGLGLELNVRVRMRCTGCGVSEDLRMLTASVPCLNSIMGACSVLELNHIHAKIVMIAPGLFDSTLLQQKIFSFRIQTERGLSKIVRCYLDRTLDKSERLSDWEIRPLREAQIIYAALDALSVVDVYRKIETRIHLSVDLQLKFTFTMARKSKPGKKQTATMGGNGAIIKQSASLSNAEQKFLDIGGGLYLDRDCFPILWNRSFIARNVSPVKSTTSPSVAPSSVLAATGAASLARSPNQMRDTVDKMLQGLEKQLKCLDLYMRIDEDQLIAAETSHLENRVILVSGIPYALLNARVPAGPCHYIPCFVTTYEPLATCTIVFNHFGIKVAKAKNIGYRCQACNGEKFVTIAANAIEEMFTRSRGQDPSLPLTSEVIVGSECNAMTAMLPNGPQIQLDIIPESVIHHVDMLYLCANCGKMLWDGLHCNNGRQKLAHLLKTCDDSVSEPECWD